MNIKKIFFSKEIDCKHHGWRYYQYCKSNCTYTCPKGCFAVGGNVIGTNIYHHSSPICLAAIHNGIITDEGGNVTIWYGGITKYVGSKRHKIRSRSRRFRTTYTAFMFTDAACIARFAELQHRPLTDSFYCPPECDQRVYNVIGNRFYAVDSQICPSAVHFGLITASKGGKVHNIANRYIPRKINGTSRNDISSSSTLGGTLYYFHNQDVACVTRFSDLPRPLQDTFYCPAECNPEHFHVIGNKYYYGFSQICASAIHDGVITAEKGGQVRNISHRFIHSFGGATRNGITSVPHLRTYTEIRYFFSRQDPACTKLFGDLQEEPQETTFFCPPGCDPSQYHVAGDQYYGWYSQICPSAVHDGVITAEDGGHVYNISRRFKPPVKGSPRNGITSEPIAKGRLFCFNTHGLCYNH